MILNDTLTSSGWWFQQAFKSKVMGIPIYFKITTNENNIVHAVFYEGKLFDYRCFGKIFCKYRSTFRPHWQLSHKAKTDPDLEYLIAKLVSVGVLVPIYESHPYHKLKNPLILEYANGPKFKPLADFLLLPFDTTNCISEQDIELVDNDT